jgi:hypothetical protein
VRPRPDVEAASTAVDPGHEFWFHQISLAGLDRGAASVAVLNVSGAGSDSHFTFSHSASTPRSRAISSIPLGMSFMSTIKLLVVSRR